MQLSPLQLVKGYRHLSGRSVGFSADPLFKVNVSIILQWMPVFNRYFSLWDKVVVQRLQKGRKNPVNDTGRFFK